MALSFSSSLKIIDKKSIRCMCMFVEMLLIKYENPHSAREARTFGWSSKLQRTISRLQLGFKVEVSISF